MANLIIKSSADNLVLQGSDASPAITVGATGTTTFAENATLSGTANNLGTVTAGNMSNSAIVYPTGHMRFLAQSASTTASSVSTGSLFTNLATGTFTAGSRIMLHAYGGLYIDATAGYAQGYFVGISASTGTASDSGLGATTSGTQTHQEFGYLQPAGSTFGYANTLVVTPTNGATNCTYNYHFHNASGSRSYTFYRQRLILWEVY